MKITLTSIFFTSFLLFSTNLSAQETGFTNPNQISEPSIEIASFVDDEASFKNGMSAMYSYIDSNLVYPLVAVENKIEGTVYIRVVVLTDGTITNPQIVRGISGCPECDREAKRMVLAMPKWDPGILDGKKVASYYQLRIPFVLKK